MSRINQTNYYSGMTITSAIVSLLLSLGCGNEQERTVRIVSPVDAGVALAVQGPVDEAGGAVIGIRRSGAYASYLVDADGRSLYAFLPDEDAVGSVCVGECAEAWPPYLTSGEPAAGGPAVEEQKIETLTRDDGSRQVAYDGRPLYFYEGDDEPGDTDGHGLDAFGGEWYLISPEGDPLERRVEGD